MTQVADSSVQLLQQGTVQSVHLPENPYHILSLRSRYLGRPCENAVVVLIETFLTPRSQTHDSQTQLTPTSLEPGTHKTHTGVLDPHRISCGESTQAPLPRKTLTHKVRPRKTAFKPLVLKVNPNQNFFFRPRTPSWLPPGRSTCLRACCN